MTQVCVHSTNAKHLTRTSHCFGCWGFVSERNKKTNKNLSSRSLINKKMREEDEADTLKEATPPGEEQSTGLLRLQLADLGRGAERHSGDEGGWGSRQHCCRREPGVGSEWQSYLLQRETPQGKSDLRDRREEVPLQTRGWQNCAISLYGKTKTAFLFVSLVFQRSRKIKFCMQWIWLNLHFKFDKSARH